MAGKIYDVFGITQPAGDEEGKGFWTRIGVGFENKDQSINLKFDYFPKDRDTNIQIREKKKDGEDDE